MNINPKPNYLIAPSLQGENATKMEWSSDTTRGSGAALQAIPKRTKRIIRIEINSNDRDFSKFPNPANFQWTLPFPIQNITSMTLVGGTVPVPIYTIDTPYNSFTFDTGSAKVTATLPPGVYTASAISQKLKTVLEAADGTNIYTVGVDSVTQLLSVETNGSNIFGFLFADGAADAYKNVLNPSLSQRKNPNYMLGFGNANYYADSSSKTLISPYPINVNPLQRIYLYMNYDTTIDFRGIFLGGGRSTPSAILYCADQDSVASFTKSLNKDTYDNIIEHGNIIPRVRNIFISLQDEFGTILNINNRPVSLLLEICVVET
jgi:hypothetical protein